MVLIEVKKEFYPYDTISRNNNRAWEGIIDKLGDYSEVKEDIMLDFKGINLIEPWLNDMFNKLISDERVNIKLYSSQQTIDTIDMACRLSNLKSGRFFNEDIVIEQELVLTPEEKAILKSGEELQAYFEEIDGKHILQVYKRYTQLGSKKTVLYIEKAIEIYTEKNGTNSVWLNTDSMSVQQNVLEALARTIGKLFVKGIILKVMSTNEDVNNKISLYQHLDSNKNMTLNDKYIIAKSNLSVGVVGMLTKYKKSRAIDAFGRQGKGEAVSCRVAIYKGIKKSGDNIWLAFTSYNGNTFYTRQHWFLEHNQEQLESLETQDILIPIQEIGLENYYLGSCYHFNMPIQYEEDGNTIMYDIEDGKVVHNTMTIPQRIKAVFDDWQVDYNESALINAMVETDKILNR